MDLIHWVIEFVLHLDKHLAEMLSAYGVWIYALLFLIIFAETGLVVTPFLPGDSLLFGVGALAAVDSSGTLSVPLVAGLLALAAILGNTTNYTIGRKLGPPVFDGRYRLIRMEYLRRTQEFFDRHGGMTIAMSRFIPIVRTFAPFVAGVGRMRFGRFQAYNVMGGTAWVCLFTFGGYLFGNIPFVKGNFGLVTLGIIFVSVLPALTLLIPRRESKAG